MTPKEAGERKNGSGYLEGKRDQSGVVELAIVFYQRSAHTKDPRLQSRFLYNLLTRGIKLGLMGISF